MKTILITHGWQYWFPVKPISALGARVLYFADSYLPFDIVENKQGEPALAFDGKPILKDGKAAIPSLAAYENEEGKLLPQYLTDPEHLVPVDEITVHIPYIRYKRLAQQKQFLRFLAHYGIASVESYKALGISADKATTYNLFKKCRVPVPESLVIDPVKQNTDEIYVAALGFYMRKAGKILLKQAIGDVGRNIYLPRSTQDMKEKLVELAAQGGRFLVQEKIPVEAPLHHIRVAVSFGEIIGVHKFIAQVGKKISNVGLDSYFWEFDLTPEQEALCLRAAKIMGINVCSLDCLISEKTGRFYILEANSMPRIQHIFPEQAQRISEDIAAYISETYDF